MTLPWLRAPRHLPRWIPRSDPGGLPIHRGPVLQGPEGGLLGSQGDPPADPKKNMTIFFMGFYSDLMGFYSDLMRFGWDFMGFMVI